VTDYSVKRFGEYSDDELIDGLRAYAQDKALKFVSGDDFSASSGVSEATVIRHFGSWTAFCERAGLSPRYTRSVSRDDLFANLDRVWQQIGRQPRAKEMKQPLSPISISRYEKEFRKPWHEVCLEFLSWRSGTSVDEIRRDARPPQPTATRRTTRRGVSLSLRYEVLVRDGHRCVKCGRSPATERGVQLHIDHIVPWSGGGESVASNLQCLCSECNLGKSDTHTG
jgi:5-methylcytosine-specific restriction endonuclease McrA